MDDIIDLFHSTLYNTLYNTGEKYKNILLSNAIILQILVLLLFFFNPGLFDIYKCRTEGLYRSEFQSNKR